MSQLVRIVHCALQWGQAMRVPSLRTLRPLFRPSWACAASMAP
ncbi:hypothetical protein [Delftia tsuruhatensis]|nr:hypothetical protein [Delftia tsuruhatensis]WGG09037.1 hypothetical protein N5O86_20600 [Delftia tsuruhatensis]